jgi:uncharacterized SAM-binding protein YcdF (DUF218 family)
VNSLFVSLGIESWKPIIAALLLPPVPFLLLVLVGARLLLPRRGLGWLVIFISVVLLWLSACTGAVRFVNRLLPSPPALSFDRVRELRAEAVAKKPLAIVILGSGSEPFAPEYGVSSLQSGSLERLRYGLWLAGADGRRSPSAAAPAGAAGSTAEARVAAKIAADEFGRPIRWIEDEAHDTRENAAGRWRCSSRRDQPRRPRHPRLPHAARCARSRSSRCRRADRGRADGACPKARAPGWNGCPAPTDSATFASCCATRRAGRRRLTSPRPHGLARRARLDYRRATAHDRHDRHDGRCALRALYRRRRLPQRARPSAGRHRRRRRAAIALRSRPARTLVTTPGDALLSQRRRRGIATLEVVAAASSRLEWLPLETIGYSGCVARNTCGSISPKAPR